MQSIRNTLSMWRLSSSAVGLRSRLISFLCARYGNLSHKRKILKAFIFKFIGIFSSKGQVMVYFSICDQKNRIFLRKDNAADYKVYGEMVLGGYKFIMNLSEKIFEIHDMGANIGLFSLYAHARLPNARITCYEPDVDNIAQLRINLASNNIEAEVIPKAIWSSTAELYFHPQESYTGFVSEEYSSYPISCICPFVPDNIWLKMDIEGSEYEVLPQILNSGRSPCLISIEIHDFSRSGKKLLKLLSESGYSWSETFSLDEECISFSAYKK